MESTKHSFLSLKYWKEIILSIWSFIYLFLLSFIPQDDNEFEYYNEEKNIITFKKGEKGVRKKLYGPRGVPKNMFLYKRIFNFLKKSKKHDKEK